MSDYELSDSAGNSPLSDRGLSLDGSEAELEDGPTNGLQLEGAPFGLEHVYDYEPGGHHPVHLGDVFDNGRFRVLHKLGNGGFANVWLCRDLVDATPKYVALKILISEASTKDCRELLCTEQLKGTAAEDANVCVSQKHFWLDGPNGSHLCFVYPVLGPKVSSGFLKSSEDPDRTLREICRQTVTAMAALHKIGICHGDFTPNNVLQQMSGLEGLSEEVILDIFGKPKSTALLDVTGERHELSTAPQYLVYPISWHSVNTHYSSNRPSVTDFGEAFKHTEPPDELGIPAPYRSPELFLEQDQPDLAGFTTDLWALGCTLFEIRTGRKLFNVYEEDEHLDAMVEILGVMPEPWWSKTWEVRRQVFRDEPDELGRAVFVTEEGERDQAVQRVHPSVAQGARSIKEKLMAGVWYMSGDGPEETHWAVAEDEMDLFADLLGRLLRWKPEERASAEEILSHEWFQM